MPMLHRCSQSLHFMVQARRDGLLPVRQVCRVKMPTSHARLRHFT